MQKFHAFGSQMELTRNEHQQNISFRQRLSWNVYFYSCIFKDRNILQEQINNI